MLRLCPQRLCSQTLRFLVAKAVLRYGFVNEKTKTWIGFGMSDYFVSRCNVCFLSREQYLFISIRSGLFRLFFFEI